MNVPGGSMVTMNNTAQGGPVGSAPMINQAAARQQQDQEAERRLNTYIFDYLCRSHHYDLARNFAVLCPINTAAGKPKSNGFDDPMDGDSKEDVKRPDNLPYPNVPPHASQNAFLYDWWCQFWDIFGAARNRGGNNISSSNTEQYLQHNMNSTKIRQMQQQQMLNQTGGNNLLQMQQFRMNMPPNGLNNMQKTAMQNARPGAPTNAALMQQKMMQQNNMQRDGSMGDNRPQSPNAMGGNAPSPSKRPRTDDGGFNPGSAGRGQPMQGGQLSNMAGGPNGSTMMLQNGMPSEMSQQQMNAFPQNPNGQQKSLEAMGANGAAQGAMAQNNMDFPMDRGQLPNGAAGGSQGNHALQDYQMQLMLLEQQNKKRLLMARQEQDNINHVPGSTPGQGGGPFAQNMSPSGSRAGPSPNPNDQMRKIAGTPKMNQNVPGSPAMPSDMQNRGTPPGNAYHEMPAMRQQMFNGNNPAMMGQPPSSHPNFNMQMAGQMNPQNVEQMRMTNGGRMPTSQQWAANGQQMMQQGQGPQGQGTPQQRNMAMPPPPAPTNQEQQRTQPSSPAQNAAPPTPNQTAKANPKGKKDGATKKQPQKAATKKGAAASTPADSNEPPATPTPSTPITPMHQQSFNQNGKTNGQPPQPAAQPPQPTNHMDTFSSDLGQDSGNFALDFAVDGPDVLENFDFDSFLHNTDDNNGFGNFDLMTFDSISGETPAGS